MDTASSWYTEDASPRLDSLRSEQGPLEGRYKHRNKSSDSKRRFNHLRGHYVLNKVLKQIHVAT